MTVNGKKQRALAEPRMLLSDFVRHGLGLTGTHVGCEHGVCGACSIRVDGEVVRSCLMLAVQVDGCTIETIEGMAKGDSLHPIQQAFQEEHGLQCGFCTPAMVLTTQRLLEESPKPSEGEIREYLSGNICRCTGYQGIVASVQCAARKIADQEAQQS
ncbi:(2Fe-2S)-binding protein [Pseudonocardia xishanensis]|uniref:(2Fe-2S)-binding protein n=1 Tax=Pseudonocardia xishanensis TaxID=630995 RepID=UPI0031EBB605